MKTAELYPGIWHWDCPYCDNLNTEDTDYTDIIDCENCGKEVEVI